MQRGLLHGVGHSYVVSDEHDPITLGHSNYIYIWSCSMILPGFDYDHRIEQG